jgi:hypothetical protein
VHKNRAGAADRSLSRHDVSHSTSQTRGRLSVLPDVALDGGDQPDVAARAPPPAADVGVLADRVVDDGAVGELRELLTFLRRAWVRTNGPQAS